jgi:hypothetical protein
MLLVVIRYFVSLCMSATNACRAPHNFLASPLVDSARDLPTEHDGRDSEMLSVHKHLHETEGSFF